MIAIAGYEDDSHVPADPYFIIDGVNYKEGILTSWKKSKQDNNRWRYEVDIRFEDANAALLKQQFSDIPQYIEVMRLYPRITLIPDKPAIGHPFVIYKGVSDELLISIGFGFDFENWKGLWSVSEYVAEYKRTFESRGLTGVTRTPVEITHEFLGGGVIPRTIYLSFPVTDYASTINEEARKHAKILQELHVVTEASLMANLRSNAVVMHFDFPEEVRVPCEQYLLYFGQFLKDLGVEAKAEIQHEAGQVLFAVTPADKKTALDKIRTALETYLQLPSNPATGDASLIEYEVAAQRLAANIDHLKGQLRLAHAELRLASATVQTQQVTIDRLLGGEIIVESLKDVTPKPKEEDKEELLSGTIALTRVSWKGVEFNLPEIFRKFRRLFKEG